MDQAEFERAAGQFAAFHRQFAALFGRKEAQARSEQYVRGLLVQQSERRNAENVAEAIEGATARALQRLLTEAPWEHQTVMTALQAYLRTHLNSSEGVFILDETGFPKQGRQSVGVARQYCGTLGKVGNCQVGVFLAYASPHGYALVDARLWLPREWTNDRERCTQAGVPTEVTYQSKAELGLAMLEQARQGRHLTGRWVTGDEAYGEVPTLRDALDAGGWWYVLEVPCTQPVFARETRVEVPPWSGRGRKPTRPRLMEGEPQPETAQSVAAQLTTNDWQTLTVAEGAQGPRTYQFAARRVWESRDGLPGRACWLLWRRNLDGSELKHSLSNAPSCTSLQTLGCVGATRWCIETEFRTTKSEIGLADYEVRSWQGWHHHVTLALLAGAFLLHMQQQWSHQMPQITRPQVNRMLRVVLPHRTWTPSDRVQWLLDTQQRNARAKQSHIKRRLALRGLAMSRKVS
jgi:SRSO17 transposase